MKRVYVNLTDEQSQRLKERAVATGVLQAEQIRRAVSLMLFADAKQSKQSKKSQRDAIGKLLEKEPELAVHFPGYKPSTEQPLFSAQEGE